MSRPRKRNKHVGSSFDEFMREQRIESPITKRDPAGNRIVALDSSNQPTSDYAKITGWAYLDKPVHGRKRR